MSQPSLGRRDNSEAPMSKQCVQIEVPEDLTFHALALHRDQRTGDIAYNVGAIERLCAHNRLDLNLFGDEDALAQLIGAWYSAHRANGGEPDPVCEELLQAVLRAAVDG